MFFTNGNSPDPCALTLFIMFRKNNLPTIKKGEKLFDLEHAIITQISQLGPTSKRETRHEPTTSRCGTSRASRVSPAQKIQPTVNILDRIAKRRDSLTLSFPHVF